MDVLLETEVLFLLALLSPAFSLQFCSISADLAPDISTLPPPPSLQPSILGRGANRNSYGMYSTLRSYEAAVEEGLIELNPEAFGNLDNIVLSLLNAFEDENSEIKMFNLTMVWVMVGKEKIGDDIDVVVRQLKSWQDSEFSLLDPMRTALVEAWGRICRCLGQEFQRHMPSDIPFLLAIAGRTTSDGVDQSIRQVISEEEKATACNILCCCAADLKEQFYPWISEVAGTSAPLVQVEAPLGTLTAALSCMLSTLRSYEAAAKETLTEWNTEGSGSLDRMVDSLLNIFKHENSAIKTVAAKAIGLCAQCRVPVFESRAGDAVSRLVTVMENFKESREKGLLMLHDNAVSALGKVIQFYGDKIEASQVINTWLNHLPIRVDRVEAQIAHHCLCSTVEHN